MVKNKLVKKNGKKKDYSLIAASGTVAIIFIAITLFVLLNSLVRFDRHEFFDPPTIFLIGTLLSFLAFILSIYLIFIYLKDYLELRSKFTLGILFMIVAFMLFSLTSMPPIHNLFGVYGRPGMFTMVLPSLFATLSLAILAWMSSK
ncbi:MAG: hypothetical protein ABII22_01935 [Candidatus Micrarchaeota archaeon]